MLDRFPQLAKDRYVAMPAGVQTELPAGIALDMLLIEVQQGMRESATPFSQNPRYFDLPLDEALAVVVMTDEGYSNQTAWWLAREASVSACVEAIRDDLDES